MHRLPTSAKRNLQDDTICSKACKTLGDRPQGRQVPQKYMREWRKLWASRINDLFCPELRPGRLEEKGRISPTGVVYNDGSQQPWNKRMDAASLTSLRIIAE